MIGVTYVYCKIWHCYCSFKNINNLYKNNFRGLGNDIRQGAWWPYKYKNKSYPILFNWRINNIWNWFLELKMYKSQLYYLFFYCFNLFTITLLASLYYIEVLFFLSVFKIDLFQHFSKTTSLTKILKYDPKTW